MNSDLSGGAEYKTTDQAQKCWNNLQQTAKTNYQKYKQYNAGTGGGPARNLSEIDSIIIFDILTEDNPTLIGVPNGLDRLNIIFKK